MKILTSLLAGLMSIGSFFNFSHYTPPPHPLVFSPKLGSIGNQIDYKFWYIKRDDNVHISEAAVRFFIGSTTAQVETAGDGTQQLVTRYRRASRVASFPQIFVGSDRIKLDANGNAVVLFFPAQFGTISTDDELRTFINGRLAALAALRGETPIPEEQ